MKQYQNPIWWDADNDFAWDHVKLEMKRDWEQASGVEAIPPLGRPTFEELEPAFRFGYGARLKFGSEHLEWDSDFQIQLIQLAEDWRTMNPTRKETLEQDRMAILYGWDYEAKELHEVVNGYGD